MTTGGGGGGRGEGDIHVDCKSGSGAKILNSREEIVLVQWHVGLGTYSRALMLTRAA
jgi:hypothetical protein